MFLTIKKSVQDAVLAKGTYAVYSNNKLKGYVTKAQGCPHKWLGYLVDGTTVGLFKTRQLAANATADYRLFSGDNSKEMWDKINATETASHLFGLREATHDALYTMGCKLQQLEHIIEQLNDRTASKGN